MWAVNDSILISLLVVFLKEDARADNPGCPGVPQDVVPSAHGHLGNPCSHLNLFFAFSLLRKRVHYPNRVADFPKKNEQKRIQRHMLIAIVTYCFRIVKSKMHLV